MSDEIAELARIIQEGSDAFDKDCQEAHAASDNPLSWAADDITSEMQDALVEIANFCRYQYIKLGLLQAQLEMDSRIVGHAGLTQGGEDIQVGWPTSDERSFGASWKKPS